MYDLDNKTIKTRVKNFWKRKFVLNKLIQLSKIITLKTFLDIFSAMKTTNTERGRKTTKSGNDFDRDVSWYLDPLLSRDFKQKIFDRRSFEVLYSYHLMGFLLSWAFSLCWKCLLARYPIRSSFSRHQQNFSKLFLKIYTNSV